MIKTIDKFKETKNRIAVISGEWNLPNQIIKELILNNIHPIAFFPKNFNLSLPINVKKIAFDLYNFENLKINFKGHLILTDPNLVINGRIIYLYLSLFRVLYKLFRTDSSNIEQTFELFPGFDNMTDTDGDGFGDRIINSINNSGRPDSNIPASGDDEFFDYQFSIDELEQFNGFQIKIVMSGTNEARPPRFRDLRVIALA